MAKQAKDRMLMGAIRLGQRDGWSRLSVSDVLQESGVARRSLYTHFPGGAKELTVAAVTLAADWITSVVSEVSQLESRAALDAFVRHWVAMLEASDFAHGCPVAAAAASRPRHPEAADLAAAAFVQWEALIAKSLVRDGVDIDEAEKLGLFVVASVEGAVIRCIAARSSEPMRVVRDQLQSVLATALP